MKKTIVALLLALATSAHAEPLPATPDAAYHQGERDGYATGKAECRERAAHPLDVATAKAQLKVAREALKAAQARAREVKRAAREAARKAREAAKHAVETDPADY